MIPPSVPSFIQDLLAQMTLEEKVAMLAGTNMWYTVPVERLGIPSLKMTDGPNGARGAGSLTGGVKTTAFPAEISLASTWNIELVERVGQALADEARMKGAQVLLAPTVNIQRSPLGGRNFECFSEDPYLSARLAVAYITGLQREGIGASIKHYVCNDQEFERFSLSSEVRERALREIYLLPFQAAVRECQPWTIMAAYNLVNGVPASESPYLLTEILRGEWGFDGVVISDWFESVKSTAASINAGLDLEMPVPRWRDEQLLEAVKQGEVSETTIDTSVRRLLLLLNKAGLFEHPQSGEEQAIDLPERRALVREAAAEGIVLLKNEQQALPLEPSGLTKIAVIGPNAKVALTTGGGSAQVNAHYGVTPLEGIAAKLGDQVRVSYEIGCTNYRLLPLLDSRFVLAGTEGNEHGLAFEYFNNDDLSGAPIYREIQTMTDIMWFNLPEGVNGAMFSARASGRFTPDETGPYTFSLVSAGLSRLSIDGREIIDNWTQQTSGTEYFGFGSSEVKAVVPLEAGHEYLLTLDFAKAVTSMLAAVRLGVLPPVPANAIERATKLAAASDVAIVCVGFGGQWQSEGFDRPDMDLPGQQNELVEQVAAANPRTIVVLNTGSPITMPWLDRVAAVLQAWYPGQECGNAIADVLFGDVVPSGKLPQTFPVRVEDNPAYLNFPGENGKVYYGEGLFVGYRYYDKKRIAPLFPFGFGLSYTTFSYSPLHLSAQEMGPHETLQVSLDVTNTGQQAGKEVVQLYVRDRQARLQRPEKELKGFAKVQLEPGESKTVTIPIGRDALAYYDDREHQWVAEAGEFDVLVGASSQDIRATATFTLKESGSWL
ncbi:MAG TPA: glycoside hydrolase family 3 C-terminal domain-containing protein [Ktedonobacteraceae bacterium]|jgi:beta-glucosidase|nr:glycoside hydrolase family 3 C-terminal domain-containing protein [Ktedonobacteraceae bacterium]